eukprot:2042113-Lingulodinium_polyedra.AAC.1
MHADARMMMQAVQWSRLTISCCKQHAHFQSCSLRGFQSCSLRGLAVARVNAEAPLAPPSCVHGGAAPHSEEAA